MVFSIRLSDEEQAMGADSAEIVLRLIQSFLSSTDKPQGDDTLCTRKAAARRLCVLPKLLLQ